jgi:uncharacterized membrane protein YeiH
MTGVAGGVMRDVLCGDVPLILRREIYATASLAGAVVYAALAGPGWRAHAASPMATLTVLGIRLATIHYGLRLPVIETRDAEKSQGED